jgi:ferric-dicitrate binding protein FerR (iron transport regulator)
MDDHGPSDRPFGEIPLDASELALWERFLAGEATAADEARIGAWAETAGPDVPYVESVRRAVWLAASPTEGAPPAVDAPAMLRSLRARLDLAARSPGVVPAVRARPSGVRRALATAAWVAAAGVMVIVTTHTQAAATRLIHLGLDDTGTYRTGPDERLRVRFPSGTEVAAAPNTSLRVAGPRDQRSVYVRGEAYVDAQGDAGQPVVVHAANVVLENAGARFEVRTDTDAKEVRIAVATGVVLAGDSGAPWRSGRILTPGTVGVVSALGATRAFRPHDPDDAMVWERGAGRFDPERLRDALPRPYRKDG